MTLNNSRSKATIDKVWYRYMITIRKHQVKDYVSKEDLDIVYNKLNTKLLNDNIKQIYKKVVYEIDPHYNQLHSHCLLYISQRPLFKRYSSFIGFRVFWRPIYDLKGAIGYLEKDAYNEFAQELILIENFYNSNYGFR